jgi:hypothetical protein
MSRREREIPPARQWTVIPPVVTTEELMVILGNGRSNLDDLLAAGMPYLDLGSGTKKRFLRFEPAKVIAWLASRNGGGR